MTITYCVSYLYSMSKFKVFSMKEDHLPFSCTLFTTYNCTDQLIIRTKSTICPEIRNFKKNQYLSLTSFVWLMWTHKEEETMRNHRTISNWMTFVHLIQNLGMQWTNKAWNLKQLQKTTRSFTTVWDSNLEASSLRSNYWHGM